MRSEPGLATVVDRTSCMPLAVIYRENSVFILNVAVLGGGSAEKAFSFDTLSLDTSHKQQAKGISGAGGPWTHSR